VANGDDPNEALLDALSQHNARTAWKQAGAFIVAFGAAIVGAVFYFGQQDEKVDDLGRNMSYVQREQGESRSILVKIDTRLGRLEERAGNIEKAQQETTNRIERLEKKRR